MAVWYYTRDGKTVLGPFDDAGLMDEARSGRLLESNHLIRKGDPSWRSASEVRGLFSQVAAVPPPPPPSPPQPDAAPLPATQAQAAIKQSEGVQKTKRAFSAKKAKAATAGEAVLGGLRNLKSKDLKKVISEEYIHKSKKLYGEFKQTDFKKEVISLDANTMKSMFRDPTFWIVLFMGVLPTFISSLTDAATSLKGLIFFFAVIWAALFKWLILRSRCRLTLPVMSFFFTGIIGLYLLLFAYRLLPNFYISLPHSSNALYSLVGYVLRVGVCEELCKLIPVFLYFIWKKGKASADEALMIGIFSGLGFAAFENISYTMRAAERTASIVYADAWRLSISNAVHNSTVQAMITVIVRSLTCVFGHAAYTGIATSFLLYAFVPDSGKTRFERRIVMVFLAVTVSSVLHGFYDWFCGQFESLAGVMDGVTFALFYGYLSRLRMQILPQNAVAGFLAGSNESEMSEEASFSIETEDDEEDGDEEEGAPGT